MKMASQLLFLYIMFGEEDGRNFVIFSPHYSDGLDT